MLSIFAFSAGVSFGFFVRFGVTFDEPDEVSPKSSLGTTGSSGACKVDAAV